MEASGERGEREKERERHSWVRRLLPDCIQRADPHVKKQRDMTLKQSALSCSSWSENSQLASEVIL
jgi:hypothetical protein